MNWRIRSAGLLAIALWPLCTSASTAYTWHFTIQDEVDSSPIEDFRVDLVLVDERYPKRTNLSCITNNDGRCTISGLVSGGNMFRKAMGSGTFTISKNEYSSDYTVASRQGSETVQSLTLRVKFLAVPRSFSVADEAGRPIEGASIRLEEARESGHLTTLCITNDAGSCTFVPKRPIIGTLAASKHGYYTSLLGEGAAASAAVLQRRPTQADLQEARAAASMACSTKEHCDRVYATAQIYMSSMTDMRVQFSNDTITETHNPQDVTQIAGRITRAPIGKQGWEVSMDLFCGKLKESGARLRDEMAAERAVGACDARRMNAYQGFRAWVQPRSS